MKKKITAKQIWAILGVVALVGLYLSSLVLALLHNEFATNMLYISLAGTIAIPVIIYFILMFYKLSHRNDPTQESEEKDQSAPQKSFRGTSIREAANSVSKLDK